MQCSLRETGLQKPIEISTSLTKIFAKIYRTMSHFRCMFQASPPPPPPPHRGAGKRGGGSIKLILNEI